MSTANYAPAPQDIAALTESTPEWFRRSFEVPREEGFVEVDGTDIHYFRWGNPANPGVVLTHGFMAHARCWAFIAPLLAKNYCLVAFDLSGMGDSGQRAQYDVEIRAKEARAVAEHTGLLTAEKRPSLVCHSYGGSVGITAAELYPDAWAAFIVCDMSMLAPDEPSRFEERRKRLESRSVRQHRVSQDFAEVRQRFRLAPEQPCANEYLMEYMAWHSVKPVEGGYIWKFDPAIMAPDNERDPDWWQSIAPRFINLTLPRAVICGELSPMMSDKVLDYIRKQTAGAVPLVQITEAHHHIMLDQPLAFAASIDALLQSFT